MGDYERGLAYGQRALAIATASGDFALEMMATFNLGIYYNILSNYRQAVHYHRKNAEALVDEWLYARLGDGFPRSGGLRFWLVRSLAELETSARATPRGRGGADCRDGRQPFILMNAYLGIGFLHLRQGDPRPSPGSKKAWKSARPRTFAPAPVCCWALGYAYALSGRLAEAQPLLEQAVELTAARLSHYPLWAAISVKRISGQPSGGGTPACRACPGTCP